MNTFKSIISVAVLAALTLSATAATIYYTDVINGPASVLRKVSSNGAGMTTLVTGIQHPRGMALDVPRGKMYWTDLGLSAIRRANLDGTGVETAVANADSGGIALDSAAQKLYWTAGFPVGRIRRANLDGSGQEDLVTNDLIHPVGIALDTQHGKIYWTDLEGNLVGGKIQRANLDGSYVETLLTGIDEANGLAVDSVGGKIYWPELGTKKIQRANLDGTDLQDLVVGLGNPTTVSLDLVQRKIYWTDSADAQTNRIQRANLDGSNVQTIISGVGFPWGIAVDSSGVPDWTTNGLIAFYPFNGNANDESGFANHGTVVGPILTTDRFGRASSAFMFDGDDFIEIPDSTAFKSQAFTISLWFNASQFPGDTSPTEAEFLISKAQNNFELALGAPGNPGTGNTGIRFLPRVGSGANWDTPASSYQTGQWHHVVAVYDPSLNSVGVFIDGQERPLLGPLSTPNTPDNSLNARLGIRQDGVLGLFGKLDDIRIYNRTFSSNEVAQLYAIESAPTLNIKKAVYLDSASLIVGKLYQVQVSTGLNIWTNYGAAFTATNSTWRSSDYFDVENWNSLFFRFQAQ